MLSWASIVSSVLSILDRVLGMVRDSQLRNEGRRDARLEQIAKGQADQEAAARVAEHVSGLSGDELDRLLRATSSKPK